VCRDKASSIRVIDSSCKASIAWPRIYALRCTALSKKGFCPEGSEVVEDAGAGGFAIESFQVLPSPRYFLVNSSSKIGASRQSSALSRSRRTDHRVCTPLTRPDMPVGFGKNRIRSRPWMIDRTWRAPPSHPPMCAGGGGSIGDVGWALDETERSHINLSFDMISTREGVRSTSFSAGAIVNVTDSDSTPGCQKTGSISLHTPTRLYAT